MGEKGIIELWDTSMSCPFVQIKSRNCYLHAWEIIITLKVKSMFRRKCSTSKKFKVQPFSRDKDAFSLMDGSNVGSISYEDFFGISPKQNPLVVGRHKRRTELTPKRDFTWASTKPLPIGSMGRMGFPLWIHETVILKPVQPGKKNTCMWVNCWTVSYFSHQNNGLRQFWWIPLLFTTVTQVTSLSRAHLVKCHPNSKVLEVLWENVHSLKPAVCRSRKAILKGGFIFKPLIFRRYDLFQGG